MRSPLAFGFVAGFTGFVALSGCGGGGGGGVSDFTKFQSLGLGTRCLRSPEYAGTQQDHFGAEVCASNACEHGTCVANCSGPQDQNPKDGCQKTSSWVAP